MTRPRPLPLLAILLLPIVLMTSTTPSPAATSGPPSDLVPWLEGLRAAWPDLDGAERLDAAEIFGRAAFAPATELLSHCALNAPELSEACTVALTATLRPEVVPTLRAIVREAPSPGAVDAAARGLMAYADRFSADLFLFALVTGRGGPEAANALIDAYEARSPEWGAMYLTHVAFTAPDPTSRALAAAEAIGGACEVTRPRLSIILEDAITDWWTDPAPRPVDARAAERAVAALLADAGGCRRVLEKTAAPPRGSAQRAALLGWLPPTCGTTARTHRPRPDRSTTSAALAPPPWAPAGAEARVKRLAQRVTPPLSDDGRRWIVPRVDGSHWGASLVPALASEAPPYRRRTERQLASFSADDVFPTDFHGFGSYLDQPAWYPRHVHITIDDGPRPVALPAILDVLADHEVKATFFFVGAVLARFWNEDGGATQALVRRVIDEGHAIGYHSMNHETAPSNHIRMWEPDQVGDSVSLFRAVLTHVLGRTHPVTIGRLPGGMGMRLPWVRRSFFDAGLYQHVHWNAGPPYWSRTSSLSDVRRQTCGIVSRDKAVVLLLHEYVHTYRHLNAFLTQIRDHCPTVGGPSVHVGERAQWGSP